MRHVVRELLRIAMEVADDARDYEALLGGVREAVDGLGYSETVLGSFKGGDVILFRLRSPGSRKRILIVAGQHGEEPAGPHALLRFLQGNRDLLRRAAVSFIPVANIHGFLNAERNGENGEHVNWFLTKDKEPRRLGRAAQCLRDHFDELGECARDGLLNLHEDETAEGFYLYVIGDAESEVVADMLKAGRRHFDPKRDGHYEDNDGYDLEGGVVDNHTDGSFDEAMVMEFDIPIAVTIETPERGATIDERAQAAAEMATVFVRSVAGRGGQ